MIEIRLTKGYVAIVDDCDADLNDFKWHVCKRYDGRTHAVRKVYDVSKKGKQGAQIMHRLILSRMLGRELLKTELVDHQDLNPLNNSRSNLRLATSSQNMANRPKPTSKNRYKGATKGHNSGGWVSCISSHPVIYLGCFDTEVEAAITYNHAAKAMYGEFARFNDIEGWENIHPKRRDFRPLRESSRGKSGIVGVNAHPQSGGWVVTVKKKYIGYFKTIDEAAAARQKYLAEQAS